jgi:hypothetical protein
MIGYEARFCKQGSERSESIKGEEFLDQVNECKLLKTPVLHRDTYDNNEVTL